MANIRDNKLLVGLVTLMLVFLLGFIPTVAVLDTRVEKTEVETKDLHGRVDTLEADRATLKQAGKDTQRRLQRIEEQLDELLRRLPRRRTH